MATITTREVKQVADLKREDGRFKLLGILGWQVFDEEEDMQQSLLLDFLYDCLMVLVEKGLPWQHISLLFTLAHQMLEQCPGKSLPEAVSLFRSLSEECTQQVSRQSMQAFTEHFFSSFMSHYKLYQYLLCQDREQLLTKMSVLVETVPEPLELSQAEDLAVWQYHQRYTELQDVSESRRLERQRQAVEQEQQDTRGVQDSIQETENLQPPLQREVLEKLIQDVANAHISAASHSIKSNIEGTCEDLSYLLQQASLPRPQVLGPPPKQQTKTPLTSAAGKRQTSQLTATRSKSRSASRQTSRVTSRLK